MIFDRAVNSLLNSAAPTTEMTLTDPSSWYAPEGFIASSTATAMKVAAVSACVEIRSDSMGKLPIFIMNNATKERHDKHYLNYLLSVRPNENMTPFVFKKLVEAQRLLSGNAYVYIERSNYSGIPVRLTPLDSSFVEPAIAKDGTLWYLYTDKTKGLRIRLSNDEVVHLKGFSEDGIRGQSILSRAAEVVNVGRQQQIYEGRFYGKNAAPSGILSVQSDLGKEARDKVRSEWESIYGGANNSFKVAILDNGLDYKQIGMSQRDAQFIESKDITVADIARFFLVPLYKLQAGKQTYSSNEQNAIEYVVTAVHPTVTGWEEELSYKLLFPGELRNNIEVRINMNAELRGDTESRVRWYKGMRDMGGYSVNDIRAYEDLPDVEGGDLRIAPLNSIPLEQMHRYFEHLMTGGSGAPGHAQPNIVKKGANEE